MPEVILGHSTEGIVVVRHQRCSCFVIGEPVFRVVALDMQGLCLSGYEANRSETIHDN